MIKTGWRNISSRLSPWIFLSPYLIFTAWFFLYPFLNAISLSFRQTSGVSISRFVGFSNYQFVLADPDFHKALFNTCIFALGSICLQLPLALLFALFLNGTGGRMKVVYRLIIFSPFMVGQIFAGIIFNVMYAPKYGLINRILHQLTGWDVNHNWLQDPHYVMPALILASLWMYVGLNSIYFLAALQNVDKSLTEAAKLDGCGSWKVFWHVSLPSIKPVAIYVVVMSTIGSFQLFELPFTLLGGSGPENAGLTIVGYLNNHAFIAGDLGTGAAVGWILTLIIFLVSLAQIRASRSRSAL
jgi:ABC-type sugar transport system permease subunit